MPSAITGVISEWLPATVANENGSTKYQTMKKIICIGECVLDIIFDGRVPVGSLPGGRVVNAAAMLAREGLPVKLVSELAAGRVGDMISSFLTDAGIDCSSVDRFTEGLTPVLIYASGNGDDATVTRYEDYPDECFDVVWPRIDEGDIVVFGGFYALDGRMRGRMSQLLAHAAERKAVMVYLPGFLAQQQPRITRVMPALLENLEFADIVLTRDNDLKVIFGVEDGDRCYHDHIDFYCRSLINVDSSCRSICYYGGSEMTAAAIPGDSCRTMIWNAGVVAGVVKSLFDNDSPLASLDSPTDDFRRAVLTSAVTTADRALKSLDHEWQRLH